jgi:hypothetical protein
LNLTARAAAIATLLLIVVCGSPREARAQYLFTPYIGGAFAGNTAFFTGLEQGTGSHLVFGGSAGWLSAGVLGIEADFAYTPGFFEGDVLGGSLGQFVVSSSALTLSGNVIVAVPQSFTGYSLRPYAVGGLGLIHSGVFYDEVLPTVDDNSLAFNVGGGAIGFLTPRTGVRFELRHFRTFDREVNELRGLLPRLSFWRMTVGVVIRR